MIGTDMQDTAFGTAGYDDVMGLTHLKIDIGNPAKLDKTRGVEFLFDSGAIYSVVPTPILRDLKIKPVIEETFRLADGSTIQRKKGFAFFRYGDRVGSSDVIFGQDGDATLLGVLTLEALGLSFDPIRRELRPLPMMLA
jgi:hypothetical protein